MSDRYSIQAEQPFVPSPEVLRRCHVVLARRVALRTIDALDAAFGASVGQWPAFPDTTDALWALQHHVRLVILSNMRNAQVPGNGTERLARVHPFRDPSR